MGLLDGAKDFLFRIALRKAALKVIQLLVARLAALKLSQYGVSLDPDAMTVALVGALEALRNYLKQKHGISIL